MNLPHPWGSTNDPGIASNCNSDDGVGDTPNTVGNSSCDLEAVSCGSLDNVQNYMEYAFCDNMFTQGRRTRMRAALNSSLSNRNNLWTASNRALTGTDGPDNLCNVDFSADQHVICTGSSITFADESYNGQSDWSWGFPGGTPATSGVANPVITYNAPGTYNVSLSVTNGSDVIAGTKSAYVIVQSEGDAMPLFESFENFDFANEEYWERIDGDELAAWEQVNYAGYSGSSSLKMDNYSVNKDGRSDFLISPSLDMSDMSSANLTFQVAFAQKIDTTKDALRVYVSTDCGATWALRFVESSSDLATVSTTSSSFTPVGASEWQQHSLSLESALMVDGFKFKIEYLNKGGNNLYLDDINLTGMSGTVPMLVSPFNGMVNQDLLLTVDWNAVSGVDVYEYQVDTQMDFSSPNLITGTYNYIANDNTGTDTQHYLSGLDGETKYYWRVRTTTNSANSNWSAIWNFTTMTSIATGMESEGVTNIDFKLFPNPTGGSSKLRFALLGTQTVQISLVDLMGREVHQLFNGILPPGIQTQKIPEVKTPGIYFVKINVGSRLFVKKLVVNN